MTFSGVGDFFSTIFDIIRTIKIVDVIDILLVSVILYYAYKFVRDRRAGKLAAGVILFLIALVISDVAGMHTIQYLFQNIFQVGVIALVILFCHLLLQLLSLNVYNLILECSVRCLHHNLVAYLCTLKGHTDR